MKVEVEYSNKEIYNFNRTSPTEGTGDRSDVVATAGARLFF